VDHEAPADTDRIGEGVALGDGGDGVFSGGLLARALDPARVPRPSWSRRSPPPGHVHRRAPGRTPSNSPIGTAAPHRSGDACPSCEPSGGPPQAEATAPDRLYGARCDARASPVGCPSPIALSGGSAQSSGSVRPRWGPMVSRARSAVRHKGVDGPVPDEGRGGKLQCARLP
jgi:hypothetical protein